MVEPASAIILGAITGTLLSFIFPSDQSKNKSNQASNLSNKRSSYLSGESQNLIQSDYPNLVDNPNKITYTSEMVHFRNNIEKNFAPDTLNSTISRKELLREVRSAENQYLKNLKPNEKRVWVRDDFYFKST